MDEILRFKRSCCGLSSSRILAIVFTVMVVGILFKFTEKVNYRNSANNKTHVYNWNSSLRTALEHQASHSKIIILALVDLGVYEMTINFYQTSILKHRIENYLFLSTNARMCDLLNAKGIYCLLYRSDTASSKRSMFGTKEFVRKMNIRTFMILEALQLGYNVLHTDVDMIFIRNPLLDLPCLDGSCDIAIMWDSSNYNAGFLFIRSTNETIELYKDMKKTAETTGNNDQVALNQALEKMKRKLAVEKLPEDKYSCGKYFYQDPGRHFGDDPSLINTPAVVIHNNWIVSIEAKIYRFKEMLQWSYDSDGYYSSRTAKYISYENVLQSVSADKESDVWTAEKKALQNALIIGALLNRSVILPKFHCGKKFCSLLNWIKIRNFDAVFKDKYRESLFLTHSRVPIGISSSLSTVYLIQRRGFELDTASFEGAIQHKPSDDVNGPSQSEILHWYGDVEESVLRFKSLHGEFKLLQNLPLGFYNTSIKAFEAAFVKGEYMQFK